MCRQRQQQPPCVGPSLPGAPEVGHALGRVKVTPHLRPQLAVAHLRGSGGGARARLETPSGFGNFANSCWLPCVRQSSRVGPNHLVVAAMPINQAPQLGHIQLPVHEAWGLRRQGTGRHQANVSGLAVVGCPALHLALNQQSISRQVCLGQHASGSLGPGHMRHRRGGRFAAWSRRGPPPPQQAHWHCSAPALEEARQLGHEGSRLLRILIMLLRLLAGAAASRSLAALLLLLAPRLPLILLCC